MRITSATHQPRSRYLDYLPAIYQQGVAEGSVNFLNGFLLACERVLTGTGDPQAPGLEEILEGIAPAAAGQAELPGIERYFDPSQAPAEFLEWLANWVALSLRADLDEARRRKLIANAASLYRMRGTKQGLTELIQIYTDLPPEINELAVPFQVGVHATIGLDTLLDGGAPFFFRVTVRLGRFDPVEKQRLMDVVRAIIDMEKPAHTWYEATVETPVFQIGLHSRVGVDTVLGAATA